ncbi:hypothetical protein ANCCAN_01394 [Ancylostoma caninum]|uniref:Peptidase S1 domain-containing protein n=1 Tax=Ancylostoma caninum TaxID=29170 RepID=A0A368H6Y8_ANCCA|nr:hypothetical protein ANCCAN_01394 [Ancylostoma caninum]
MAHQSRSQTRIVVLAGRKWWRKATTDVSWGDSGGPLFQTDENNRHILVGINSSGGASRPKADIGENYKANYVDLRAYLDWICKYSGVCPTEDDSSDKPLTNNASTQKNHKKGTKS